MTNRKNKTDSRLQNWLNHFTDQVDYQRFQRGMVLYNDHQIRGFQVFPNHFECVVEGVQGDYEVDGYFQLVDGIPLLPDYEVTCSCPDDAAICKHSVGATMYFILDQLSSNEEHGDQTLPDARAKLIEEPLMELAARVDESQESILTLHNKRESRIIENKMFIERVHERIVEVMDELRKRKI
ncbi:SWIM zinc finger family protein [Pseudalkalibacillus sp. R45]|uniref:SWIM zinc finger family protein n=1 Tax=Pseudalkalibacillus sp. R45 TaxID=3457433 RepID=UPI003FCE7DC0